LELEKTVFGHHLAHPIVVPRVDFCGICAVDLCVVAKFIQCFPARGKGEDAPAVGREKESAPLEPRGAGKVESVIEGFSPGLWAASEAENNL
jgi:hypothetical protein